MMFTDMVGYTALVLADEHAGIEKRGRYWQALEREHEAHGGTVSGSATARSAPRWRSSASWRRRCPCALASTSARSSSSRGG
jgi:hypothetical protein